MTAAILKAAGRRTFLGGNIGLSLLEHLPEIRPDDWVVLEISSFQLWHFRIPHAPREDSAHGVCRIHVAVVTGCSPNHLDWHESYADYVAAEQRILTWQTPEDFAVLNTFDAEVASWSPLVRGRPIDYRRHTPCAVAEDVAGTRRVPVPHAERNTYDLPAPGSGPAQSDQRRLCGRGGDGRGLPARGRSTRTGGLSWPVPTAGMVRDGRWPALL